MSQVQVQFSDESEELVVAVLGGVGDEETYPYQGAIGIDDPRYAAFFDGLTPFAQENAGLPKPMDMHA